MPDQPADDAPVPAGSEPAGSSPDASAEPGGEVFSHADVDAALGTWLKDFSAQHDVTLVEEDGTSYQLVDATIVEASKPSSTKLTVKFRPTQIVPIKAGGKMN